MRLTINSFMLLILFIVSCKEEKPAFNKSLLINKKWVFTNTENLLNTGDVFSKQDYWFIFNEDGSFMSDWNTSFNGCVYIDTFIGEWIFSDYQILFLDTNIILTADYRDLICYDSTFPIKDHTLFNSIHEWNISSLTETVLKIDGFNGQLNSE